MKPYKLYQFLLPVFFIIQGAAAQETIDNNLEQQIEAAVTTENPDYNVIAEQLEYYKKHPLNINKATTEQLQSLQLLSALQINNLQSHLKLNGKLLTIYELQSINGFDLNTINQILPYVTVTTDELTNLTLPALLKIGKFTASLRYQQVIEQQKGYRDITDSASKSKTHYSGNPLAFVNRYRFNSNNQLFIGVAIQKDAGEKLTSKKQSLSELYSAYVLYRGVGFIKTFAAGDYQVAFGQGLNAWQSIYFVKTVNAIAINRSGFNINPHTSTSRNNYFRGIATTASYKNLELTTFISRITKPVGNNTDTLNSGINNLFTSYENDSNRLVQNTYGAHLRLNHSRLQIGLTSILNSFNTALTPAYRLYSQFTFRGKQLTTVSADYNYTYHNFNLFGEAAMSNNGGTAYLNGLVIALDPRLAISFLHRHYQRNYQSLFANAFSENTKPANENGIYTGIQFTVNNHLNAVGYYDQFRFPWLKYLVNAPSQGNEWMLQFNYMQSKKLSMYAGVHQKTKMSNSTIGNYTYIATIKQINYRYQIDYSISPAVKLRNRVELTILHNAVLKNQQGFLIYQDINYKLNIDKISFNLRYGLFDTDSYSTRIYGFEASLPGAYSLPAYYDKGMYCYLMLNYTVSSKITCWLRYAVTSYSNKKSIEPGTLNEIDGNTKSDIKALLRVTF